MAAYAHVQPTVVMHMQDRPSKESKQPRAHLRLRQIIPELLPIGESTLRRMVRDNEFPKPVRISKSAVAWVASEVYEWLEKRERV